MKTSLCGKTWPAVVSSGYPFRYPNWHPTILPRIPTFLMGTSQFPNGFRIISSRRKAKSKTSLIDTELKTTYTGQGWYLTRFTPTLNLIYSSWSSLSLEVNAFRNSWCQSSGKGHLTPRSYEGYPRIRCRRAQTSLSRQALPLDGPGNPKPEPYSLLHWYKKKGGGS